MKGYSLKKSFFGCIYIVVFLGASILTYAKSGMDPNINRFNVVIILDASNSMNYTDPNGLRYEAVSQFTDLLAESGNYLGGVVFSNHVESKQAPIPVESQDDKENVTAMLESVMSDGVTESMGYTNIGEALLASVDMLLSSGNSNLPSVIVFLSDGNTEMPSEEEQAASLDQKADAIQKAREQNISIYAVCLNANNKADISEMRQISDATGGKFQEVAKAENLQDVFNAFYSLIYGTLTVNLADDVFPESGVLETEFEIPGIGVEEVNIVINGAVSDMALLSPDGSDADMKQASSRLYTLVKMRDVVPGKWVLVTEGVPGSSIRVNMIYNTNLGIDIKAEPEGLKAVPGETVRVMAKLNAGDMAAVSAEQYTGFEAKLKILNAYQEEIDSIAMKLGENGFEADYAFEEGAYYANVNVSGNHLEKDSELLGPFIISENALDGELAVNTAPEPIDTPVKKKVYIWPFKGGSIEVDLGALAKDAQKDKLVYEIVSSSFIEGTDYVLYEDKLVVDHFSLSKGSFDIKVTDTCGLFCNVELIVTSYNIGVITCIILAVGAAAVLMVVGFSVWWWSRKPFGGTITVNGCARTPKRGRCRLSLFRPEATGLNLPKCYFQATGDNYVYLVTDIPLKSNQLRETGKKTKIRTGIQVTLKADKEGVAEVKVKFESRIKQGSAGNRTSRRKATRPVRR